jgi:hypothetical protein
VRRFLAGRGHDHRMGNGGALAAQPPDEAPHACVPRREAMLIDEVLPDGHGVPAAAQRELDQLAVRFAGPRARGPAGRRRPPGQVKQTRRPWRRVGGHLTGRICGVGGHLTGRFWWRPAPARLTDRDPSGLEIGARRFPADPGRLFDTTKRPSQPPQCQNLLLPVVPQEVGRWLPARQRLGPAATSLAGFQVSTTGRFWVSTEAGARTVLIATLDVPHTELAPIDEIASMLRNVQWRQ